MNTCILAIIYTVKMYAIGQWVEKIKSKYSGRIGAWWWLLHDRQKTYWWVSNAYKNPWYITRTVLLFFSSPKLLIDGGQNEKILVLTLFWWQNRNPTWWWSCFSCLHVYWFSSRSRWHVWLHLRSLPWQFFWFCFRFWGSRVS